MMAFAGIGPAPGPSSTGNAWSIWGQTFERWSRVDSTADAPGSKSRSGGFVLGADRYLSSDWLAGVAFGFARTRTNSDALAATSDTYSGAAYTTWMPGRFVFDARAAIGPAATSTTRSVDFVRGTISGNAHGVGGLIHGGGRLSHSNCKRHSEAIRRARFVEA